MALIDVLEIQHTGDQDLELAQQNIKRFVKVLEDNPVLDGRLIEDIDVPLPPATVEVEHKLDRQPRGWIVCDVDASTYVYRIAWNDKTIVIAGRAAATISIWVF